MDLVSALRGPVFARLQEVAYFRQFTIHPEFHTVVWPNGADLAPEYLHQQARVSNRDDW